jgi:hypothetical protein
VVDDQAPKKKMTNALIQAGGKPHPSDRLPIQNKSFNIMIEKPKCPQNEPP